MYFISKKSWILHRAHTLSPYKRYALTFVIFGFTILVWYLVVYRSVAAQYSYYEEQLVIEHAKEGALEILQKDYQRSTNILSKHKKKLACLYKKQETFDLRIENFFAAVAKDNITLKGYAPEVEKQKEWRLQKPVSFTLEGSFEQIASLLKSSSFLKLQGMLDSITFHKLSDDILRLVVTLRIQMLQESAHE